MLKSYLESLKRLSTDKDGVVSFEYVIVAALVVGAVGVAFGNGTTGIGATLSGGLTAISGAVSAALPAAG